MSIQVAHNFKEALWDWPIGNDGIVKVTNTSEKFEVHLDAQQFTPNEIQVKAANGQLEIHLEHSPRADSYGRVTRSISRSYRLPDDIDPTTLKSTLGAQGMLIISATKK